MAQLGKMEFTILNPDGSPASGVTLTIRKQGAQVRGSAGASPYTVDDVGAVATGATVALYATSTKTETSSGSATVNSATSIGVAPNLGAAADDDRITVVSPAPTVYEDANGGTSISATLTTDTTGRAEVYAEAGFYDVKQTGGGLTSRLYTDVTCAGAKATAYQFDAGTAVGFSDNLVNPVTGSTLSSAGAVIREFKHAGTRKASIDKDGDFTGTDVHAVNIDTSGTLAVGSSATVGTTLGVTGASTLAALTASGLITGSAGLTISAGAVSLPAASLAVAALASGITSGSALNQTGSQSLSTTPTTLTNCSITQDVAATSSVIVILGKALASGGGATARTATYGIYEDGALLTGSEGSQAVYSNAGVVIFGTATALAVRTGVSAGNHTYTLKGAQNAGTDVTASNGTLMVLELKK